ncbi:hypothetical protein [Fibrobacter succinogenes]|uniref:Lipoprotein n=1 Tax=Fibrobacter succinogenes TaxID=833 RepID=A0A380S938_FIBSU|nr:hypothetical protein [Fibrobacter succinogenes]PWJ33569.1 hypothetical protein IE02_2743 [Fibrobacter succinogenes subsp. elongatus]SUQ25940.1 hypothetical protein SAMN05661053_2743 [Fibrobacter succinogenes]
MRHLIPSLCLALLLAETACSAPHAVKQNDSDNRQKNAATRQRAESAYNELDGFASTTNSAVKSTAAAPTAFNASAPAAVAQKTSAATETYANASAIQDIRTPIIMVSPNLTLKDGVPDLSSESPYSRTTAEAINGYLTKKNYEVKSVDGQAELSSILQMQSDIANTEDDLSYLASVALDADIYIKYTPEVTNDEVSVEVSAYETSTARLLGSQSAVVRNNGHTSKININSNIGAAVRKAMPGLEQKILGYWKMDLAKGTQYKVVVNIKGEYSDSQTEDLHDAIMKGLKSNFSSVKVNVMTAKTLDFVIYANPLQYKDSQEVYSKIRQVFKPIAETKKNNITRKLILMELN